MTTPTLSTESTPSPITSTPTISPFGTALSGCLGGAVSWWSPSMAQLQQMKADGVKYVSIPVWFSADLTKINPLIDLLHELGMTVHVVPHLDGLGDAIDQEPFTEFPAYVSWFTQVVAASSHLQPGETFELWNEMCPDSYNWSQITTLYQAAPLLSGIVRACLPGIKIVLPAPNDQSPEQAVVAMASWDAATISAMQAGVKGGLYDVISFHIYEWAGVDPLPKRFTEATALATLIGLPIMVTEFGSGLADAPTFYQTVAAWTKGTGIAWQAYCPGDLSIIDNPPVLKALQTWNQPVLTSTGATPVT